MLTRACFLQTNTVCETLRKFAISLAAAACVAAPSALAPPEVGIAPSRAWHSCVPLNTHAAAIGVKDACNHLERRAGHLPVSGLLIMGMSPCTPHVRISVQLAPLAEARLTAGDPIKNARAILRYALPIENTSMRRVQVQCLTFCPWPPAIHHAGSNFHALQWTHWMYKSSTTFKGMQPVSLIFWPCSQSWRASQRSSEFLATRLWVPFKG